MSDTVTLYRTRDGQQVTVNKANAAVLLSSGYQRTPVSAEAKKQREAKAKMAEVRRTLANVDNNVQAVNLATGRTQATKPAQPAKQQPAKQQPAKQAAKPQTQTKPQTQPARQLADPRDLMAGMRLNAEEKERKKAAGPQRIKRDKSLDKPAAAPDATGRAAQAPSKQAREQAVEQNAPFVQTGKDGEERVVNQKTASMPADKRVAVDPSLAGKSPEEIAEYVRGLGKFKTYGIGGASDVWASMLNAARDQQERDNVFGAIAGASLRLFDPDDAAKSTWDEATARYEAGIKRNEQQYLQGGPATLMNDRLGMSGFLYGAANYTDELKERDIYDMCQTAWDKLEQSGAAERLIRHLAGQLAKEYPGADPAALREYARQEARRQSDLRMFDHAKEMSKSNSAATHFLDKMIEGNSVMQALKGLARISTGGKSMPYKQAALYEEAKDHPVADIAGMVAGMALDPALKGYGKLAQGAAGLATKAGVKVFTGGGQAAVRAFSSTMPGKVLGSSLTSMVNLSLFEGVGEGLRQFAQGGRSAAKTDSDIEQITGVAKGKYSGKDVAGSFGHGLLMGGGIGWISPVFGNWSDKLTKSAESTVGKAATRAALFNSAVVAEGTIFGLPEMMDPDADAGESWLRNVFTMYGFKAGHIAKTGMGHIGVACSGRGRRGYVERLRARLDAPTQPGLALTEHEMGILADRGHDLRGILADADSDPERFKAGMRSLEADKGVPIETKAKIHCMGTGKPMSATQPTVWGVQAYKFGDGYVVESLTSDGEVVTSQSYKTAEQADKRRRELDRTVELNRAAVGEQQMLSMSIEAAKEAAMQAAKESAGADDEDVMALRHALNWNRQCDMFGLEGRKVALGERQEALLAEYVLQLTLARPRNTVEPIKEGLAEQYGVDVEAALGKEPRKRTVEESKAVSDYLAAIEDEVGRDREGYERRVREINEKYGVDVEFLASLPDKQAYRDYDHQRRMSFGAEMTGAQTQALRDNDRAALAEYYEARDANRSGIYQAREGLRSYVDDKYGVDVETLRAMSPKRYKRYDDERAKEFESREGRKMTDDERRSLRENDMAAVAEYDAGLQRNSIGVSYGRGTEGGEGSLRRMWAKDRKGKVMVVTSGRVAVREDGTVDVANSDETVTLADDKTGERVMVHPSELAEAGELPAAADAMYGEAAEPPAPMPEQRPAGQPTELPLPPERTERDGGRYAGKAIMKVRNGDGEVVTLQLTGRRVTREMADEYDLYDAEDVGKWEYYNTATGRMECATAEELDALDELEFKPLERKEERPAELPATGTPAADADEGGDGDVLEPKVAQPEPDVADEDVLEPEVAQPQEPPTALGRLPKKEDGKPDFEGGGVTAAHAAEALTELAKGDTGNALKVAQARLAKRKTELAKAKKAEAKGADEIELMASAEANAEAEREAQRRVDHWQEVVDRLTPREPEKGPEPEPKPEPAPEAPKEESAEDEAPKDEAPKEESVEQEPPTEAEQEPEETEGSAGEMPYGDDGNPSWYDVSPRRGRRHLYEEVGYSREEADEYAEKQREHWTAVYDKLKDKKPKVELDMAKRKKKVAEWEAKVAEARDKAKYWEDVLAEDAAAEKEMLSGFDRYYGEEAERAENMTMDEMWKTPPEDDTEEILHNLSEPLNDWEAVYLYLVMCNRGHGRLRITPESWKREMGRNMRGEMRMMRPGSIAKKENGGRTIERIAHNIWEEYGAGEGTWLRISDKEVKDIVIDILLGGTPNEEGLLRYRKELLYEHRTNNPNVPHGREEALQWFVRDKYGMDDPQEALSYEETKRAELWDKHENFDEREYNDKLADEMAEREASEREAAKEEDYGDRQEPETEPEGVVRGDGEGGGVLHLEGAAERDRETKGDTREPSGETGHRDKVDSPDGDVPESPSGREGIEGPEAEEIRRLEKEYREEAQEKEARIAELTETINKSQEKVDKALAQIRKLLGLAKDGSQDSEMKAAYEKADEELKKKLNRQDRKHSDAYSELKQATSERDSCQRRLDECNRWLGLTDEERLREYLIAELGGAVDFATGRMFDDPEKPYYDERFETLTNDQLRELIDIFGEEDERTWVPDGVEDWSEQDVYDALDRYIEDFSRGQIGNAGKSSEGSGLFDVAESPLPEGMTERHRGNIFDDLVSAFNRAVFGTNDLAVFEKGGEAVEAERYERFKQAYKDIAGEYSYGKDEQYLKEYYDYFMGKLDKAVEGKKEAERNDGKKSAGYERAYNFYKGRSESYLRNRLKQIKNFDDDNVSIRYEDGTNSTTKDVREAIAQLLGEIKGSRFQYKGHRIRVLYDDIEDKYYVADLHGAVFDTSEEAKQTARELVDQLENWKGKLKYTEKGDDSCVMSIDAHGNQIATYSKDADGNPATATRNLGKATLSDVLNIKRRLEEGVLAEGSGLTKVMEDVGLRDRKTKGDTHEPTEFDKTPKRGSEPGRRLGRAVTGLLRKAGIKVVTDGEKVRREYAASVQAMTVWHGSPYVFEGFDHSHMGKGEGYQVHGWGTYVAMDEATSRAYAENLAQKVVNYVYNGKRDGVSDATLKDITDMAFDGNPRNLKEAYVDWLDWMNDRVKGGDEWLNDLYKAALKLDPGSFERVESINRNLYEVEIPDDNGENYLHERQDITPGQRKRLYEALRKDESPRSVNKLLGGYEIDGELFEEPIPGKTLYKNLSIYFGSDKAASEFLSSLSFVGIRYDGRQDGPCAVIFKEADLKIKNRTEFLRTRQGEVYGFVKDGVIYLDPDVMNPNTPLHEYTHLWARAARVANPEFWARGKEILREHPLWRQVEQDAAYADIAGDEDLVASEVLSRLTGENGAAYLERMVEEARRKGDYVELAKAVSLRERVNGWLKELGAWVRDAFSGNWSKKELDKLDVEELWRMPLRDLAKAMNPAEMERKGRQSERIRRTNPAQDDYHRWVRNAGDVKTFDEVLAEAERDHAEYGELEYPDMRIEDMRDAKENGRITVYSSKPITDGAFVTPSRMNAKDYAGGGKVYSKEVSVDDVAWLGPDEGQMAPVGRDGAEPQGSGGSRGGIELMFLGEKGAAAADKATEATTRMDNLRKAEEMERKFEGSNDKESAKKIKLATGWERGADGKWRYEEPDEEAVIKGLEQLVEGGKFPEGEVRLGELLGEGTEILAAYPEMSQITVVFDREGLDGGGYNPENGTITLRTYMAERQPDGKDGYLADVGNTLVHELQHAVQHIEGFASGGNLDISKRIAREKIEQIEQRIAHVRAQAREGKMDRESAVAEVVKLNKERARLENEYDVYKRLAGEVEARNVSRRMDMGAGERRESLAEETEDVPRDGQILLREGGGAQASYGEGARLKAPNGKATRLDAKQWEQVRTKAFKKWFGDWKDDPENASKAVDDNGEPLVVDGVYVNTSHDLAGMCESVRRKLEKARSLHRRVMDEAGGSLDDFMHSSDANAEEVFRLDDTTSRIFHRLLYGEEVDAVPTVAFRYGDIREEGKSWNYRDRQWENGVSVVGRVADLNTERSDYYEAFFGDKPYNVVFGFDIGERGADGEVLLSDAVVLGDDIGKTVKSATENSGGFSGDKEDILFRTSGELDKQYPEWLSGQTTDSGRHTTQITSTKATYEKIGNHLLGEGKEPGQVSVLDASSGLGVGTRALRDMGFDVEDVEPYPSEEREAPTYKKYEDVGKKYDVVISNAVLNVIPDDWRADVLKSMADKLNVGGRLFINVRDAAGVAAQKQKVELDSPSEILVTDKKGKIRAYQKGFTKKELLDYVKSQLGEGFEVEAANAKNSGLGGGTAVVVTRTGDKPLEYRKAGESGGAQEPYGEKNGKPFGETEKISNLAAKEIVEKIKDVFWEGAAAEHRVAAVEHLQKTQEGRDVIDRLYRHRGTDWSKAAANSVMVRIALEDLLAGREPRVVSMLTNPDKKGRMHGAVALIKRQGVDGIWTYLTQKGFIGSAAKCVNNVNGSYLDCRPSDNCAKFCYASKGNSASTNSIVKNELIRWAVAADPQRAADMIARQYQAKPEWGVEKSLRLFEAGDLDETWLPVIEELNRRGITTQIFSKNPQVLERVDAAKNVVMMSIDSSNVHLLDEYPDLPVAFVYAGKADLEVLLSLKDRFANRMGVILPVVEGKKVLGKEDLKSLPSWTDKWLCPIDRGIRKIKNPEHPELSWNCTKCDVKGGVGCFRGRTTKQLKQNIHDIRRNDIRRSNEGLRVSAAPGNARSILGGDGSLSHTNGGGGEDIVRRRLFQILREGGMEASKITPELLEALYRASRGDLGDRDVYVHAGGVQGVGPEATGVSGLADGAGSGPERRGRITDGGALPKAPEKAVTAEEKTAFANELCAGLNTKARICHSDADVMETESYKRADAATRERMLASKGWFDPRTGEVVVLEHNNADAADVMATVFHETVAHKGLRELVGEERYGEFLDEVASHLRKNVRKAVETDAQRRFMDDVAANGGNASGYEHHRRVAMEEYLGRLAEKNPETFTAAERDLWRGLKERVVKAVNKLLATMKLPGYVRLGDDELRYILRRSAENLKAQGGGGAAAEKSDAGPVLFRDGETGHVWNDKSLGIKERVTQARALLAAGQEGDVSARNDAIDAARDNLKDLLREMRKGNAPASRTGRAEIRGAVAAQRSYDRATVKRVTDLANVMLQAKLLTGASESAMRRLFSAVGSATGREDIGRCVDAMVDVMANQQIKNAKAAIGSLLKIGRGKVDAKGVEVQGAVDDRAVRTVKTFKEGVKLSDKALGDAMDDALERMAGGNDIVRESAEDEYAGLSLARSHRDIVQGAKDNLAALRRQVKQAKEDHKAGLMSDADYAQFVSAALDAIKDAKLDQVEAHCEFVGQLADVVRGGVARAEEFRKAEMERVSSIAHMANADMEGMDAHMHRKPGLADKAANALANTLLNPLATFEQMVKSIFGRHAADGEGYVHDHFVNGLVKARETEITKYNEWLRALDEKVAEMFGGRGFKRSKALPLRVKTHTALMAAERALPKGEVEYVDRSSKERRALRLPHSVLRYIYMVDKMPDGRMKLRGMGIDEDAVAAIEAQLDPTFKEFADWLQEEFLEGVRLEANEVHKRVNGVSMARIDDYFPLKVSSDARKTNEDLDDDDTLGGGVQSVAGSWRKRTANTLDLDLENADASIVLLDHLSEQAHTMGFVELARDMNTLMSMGRVRNRVKNMRTAYGAGDELWARFKTHARIAFGTYKQKETGVSKAAVRLGAGATAGCVSLRVNTALKQLLSLPAVIPELSASGLAIAVTEPKNTFMWAMRELPVFKERWQSRLSGDPRLKRDDSMWKNWRRNVVSLGARWGMTPNAFVDAVACSIVAHAVYTTRRTAYERDGFSKDAAEERAKVDATRVYNLSQQSSEGAYLSEIQAKKDLVSVALTVFRNSPMSYTRQVLDAARELERVCSSRDGRAKMVEYMAKQNLRQRGIDAESATDAQAAEAKAAAERRARRAVKRDILRLVTFGAVLPGLWSVGGYWTYLLLGRDDDEKERMLDDVAGRALTMPIEGVLAGDVWSNMASMAFTGEAPSAGAFTKEMPFYQQLGDAIDKYVSGKEADAYADMANMAFQMGFAVDLKTVENLILAVDERCGGDPALANEALITAGRVLSVPESQLKKLYFDEIEMTGEAAAKLTPYQIAERYATVQVKRGRPVLHRFLGEDKAAVERKMAGATAAVKERLAKTGDKEAARRYEAARESTSEMADLEKAFNKAAKTDYIEAAAVMSRMKKDPEAFRRHRIVADADAALKKMAGAYLRAGSRREADEVAREMDKVRRMAVAALDDAGKAQAMRDEIQRWKDGSGSAADERLKEIRTEFNDMKKAQ